MSLKVAVLFVFLLIATKIEANENIRAKVYAGKEVTLWTSSSFGVSLIQCQTMCVLVKRKCKSRICGYDKVSKTCFCSFDTDCNVISAYETTKVVIKPDGADACQSTGYLLNGADPVSDAQITSSTDYSPSTDSRGFRLHTVKTDTHEGAWAAGISDTNQYIQVRFYRLKHVSGVALQGKADYAQYVTAYKVLYSCDCANFRTIKTTNGYDKM